MIQILALREFQPGKKAEVWFERGMRAPSVESIFSEPLPLIKDKTELSERFNMYYTVAECLEERGRKLHIQHHIPFDVDGIDVPDTGLVAHLQGIARVVCSAIGVKYEETGILFSGNGLQLLVGTTHPITDVAYFDQVRKHYKSICDHINLALQKAEIKGKADPSVWSPARLMRYPGTTNIKPNKPERVAKILQGKIDRIDFTLEKASRIPTLQSSDYVNQSVAATFPTPDVKSIMSECEFLKWAQIFPEQVTEPLWYASLSLTSRFPEGRAFSHKMSEGHPGYSFEETEIKIDQALDSSGPRTCQNIDSLSDKCKSCKHFGKLTTPLLIEGPDHIKTQNNGFYDTLINDKGEVRRGKPNYHDLRKFFVKEHKYKVTPEGMFWKWAGTHYEEMKPAHILQFAENNFNPKPNQNMRSEFLSMMKLYNVVDADWFTKSTKGKMNFQNGVFDVESGILYPTSPEHGFRTTLPCEYQPTAQAPRFLQFMNEITDDRPELVAILQEYLGYVFAGAECKYEKILFLLGDGENGKSTFVRIVRALAGIGGTSNLSIKALQNDQNRALLEGKLVNIAEENSKDAFRDTELIKNMASGGVVQVKRVYLPPYEFENFTKIIMLCNSAPASSDHTHGFFRKMLIVPFDRVFSGANKDINLYSKMLSELPGIFNWVMEGYKRLIKQGYFTEASASIAVMEEYKREVNPIYTWFEEACEVSTDVRDEANRQEMYFDYESWCQRNGNRFVAPLRDVVKFIKVRIKSKTGKEPQEHKRQKDGVRHWAISNIKFNQKADF